MCIYTMPFCTLVKQSEETEINVFNKYVQSKNHNMYISLLTTYVGTYIKITPQINKVGHVHTENKYNSMYLIFYYLHLIFLLFWNIISRGIIF